MNGVLTGTVNKGSPNCRAASAKAAGTDAYGSSPPSPRTNPATRLCASRAMYSACARRERRRPRPSLISSSPPDSHGVGSGCSLACAPVSSVSSCSSPVTTVIASSVVSTSDRRATIARLLVQYGASERQDYPSRSTTGRGSAEQGVPTFARLDEGNPVSHADSRAATTAVLTFALDGATPILAAGRRYADHAVAMSHQAFE